MGRIQLPASELAELAHALSNAPRPAIRLHPDFARELPFATVAVGWHPRGRWVSPGTRPGGCLWYGTGGYYIQDAASLLPVTLLAAQPGDRVCDLCAAPGGKSTALLEDLGAGGWLLANETIRSRVEVLELNLARHGATRFVVTSLDPVVLANLLTGHFDAVLVDAPCTGQTLIGRGKQTSSSLLPGQIEHSAARQSRILEAAARLVRPGGRLVYATCTLADAENEAQIEGFLARHGGWHLEPQPALAPWASPLLPDTYRLWPHRDGCAGGYAACLRYDGLARVEGEWGEGRAARTSSSRGGRGSALVARELPAEFQDWGALEGSVYFAGARMFGWPEPPPGEFLAAAWSGPEVAQCPHRTWLPAYGLAMRRDPHWRPHQRVELTGREAAAYLGGETVAASLRGLGIAGCDGAPLGWLKGDGRVGKNLLPKPARLRIGSAP